MLLQNFRPIRGGLVGKIVLDGPRQISFEFEDGIILLSKNGAFSSQGDPPEIERWGPHSCLNACLFYFVKGYGCQKRLHGPVSYCCSVKIFSKYKRYITIVI